MGQIWKMVPYGEEGRMGGILMCMMSASLELNLEMDKSSLNTVFIQNRIKTLSFYLSVCLFFFQLLNLFSFLH